MSKEPESEARRVRTLAQCNPQLLERLHTEVRVELLLDAAPRERLLDSPALKQSRLRRLGAALQALFTREQREGE